MSSPSSALDPSTVRAALLRSWLPLAMSLLLAGHAAAADQRFDQQRLSSPTAFASVLGETIDIGIAANGDFVAAWAGMDQFSNTRIYARRFLASGVAKDASEIVVASAAASPAPPTFVTSPSVAVDANGNFVVAWVRHVQGRADIHATCFGANGTVRSGPFRVNTTSLDRYFTDRPAVAIDAAGDDFVVAWQRQTLDETAWKIFGRTFGLTAAGVLSPRAEFFVHGPAYRTTAFPDVAMDTDGDIVVTFGTTSADLQHLGRYDIYLRHYSRTGVARTVAFFAGGRTYDNGKNTGPSVAMNGVGDYVVTWTGQEVAGVPRDGVWARRFNAGGGALAPIFAVADYGVHGDYDLPARNPDVAREPGGAFIITWTPPRIGGGARDAVPLQARKYAADQTPLWTIDVSHPIRFDAEARRNDCPAIAINAAGNFVVAWLRGGLTSPGVAPYVRGYIR